MIFINLFFLLLSNAVTLRRDKSILYSRVAIAIFIYCSYITLIYNNIGAGISLYGGLFHDTKTTKTFQIFIFIICGVILLLTAFYSRKFKDDSNRNEFWVDKNIVNISMIINKMAEHFKIMEYSLIILFIICGALLLMSSSDLISIFLSIELQSYGLYLLSTIYKNSELASRGGLTYFLLGGLSSCFILLGSSLLYVNSGITSLDGIFITTSLSNISDENILYLYKPDYINLSMIILSVGFLFKVSAAPFHFWSPDVYDAIPTIVTTFVAIVAKISIFIFFLELVHYTGKRFFPIDYNWTNCLLVSSLLSLIIGTIAGLTQNRIKRLLAYSTISHIGFILLALTIDSIESIQAFIFYLMQYSITNLNAFLILISIGFSYYFYKNNNKEYEQLEDKNNSPIQLTKQMKGYFYLNPVLALSFTITVFSFVGIPPLIGFFAKQMVLSAALDSGYIFITLIAILTSVISAVYYLNIIKELFFFPGENNKKLSFKQENINLSFRKKNKETLDDYIVLNIVLSSYLTITISVLSLGILLFIFMPKEWLSMANILALNLNDTHKW